MIAWIRFVLTAALVIPGLIVCCIGVYGMFRFDYAANRMHAAALIDTMGIALCVAGLQDAIVGILTPDRFFSSASFYASLYKELMRQMVEVGMLGVLEIVTDEQRDEYMVVHGRTLAQERGEDAAQPAQDDSTAAVAEANEPVNEAANEAANEEQTEVEQP